MEFLKVPCCIYVTLSNVDNFKAKEYEFKSLEELKGYMDSGYHLIQNCFINGNYWDEGSVRKLIRTFK